jgi:hypothetical protein
MPVLGHESEIAAVEGAIERCERRNRLAFIRNHLAAGDRPLDDLHR